MTGADLRDHRLSLGLSQAKFSELCEVSQHVLSAFELGKASLSKRTLAKVSQALNDKDAVNNIVTRKKRYVAHNYRKIDHLEARVARARRTKGNLEYTQLIKNLECKRNSMANSSLSALSLFSGCGGFTLGCTWAGFKVLGHVEIDDAARRIYRDNFPDSIELGSDIANISDAAILKTARQRPVDVIIGGPPCQGFSLSGKREIGDPRNALFRHYLRFVDGFKPSVAVLENVSVLTSMRSPSGTYIRDEIQNEFERHGYLVKQFAINAKDFGVPQHRERVLFIATRKDLPFTPSLPDPTFGRSNNLFSNTLPWRTFADACSDLEYLESGESSTHDPLHHAVNHPSHVIDWLWDVNEGKSAHENQDATKRPPSGYNTTYKRQVWLEPASTVQTTFGMISGCRNVHPIATRSLTIREAARIQSFPDSFAFKGNLGAIRTAIGNAVPPLLGYMVGSHIRNKMLQFIKVSGF